MKKPIPLFNDTAHPYGPPLTASMVEAAEAALGVRLPRAYISVLETCNGGDLRRTACPTSEPTSWHDDYVEIRDLMGIGGSDHCIDEELGSQYLIEEWGYPEPGVVLSSEGHTAFLLDYRECGPTGEPRVIFVDVDTDEEPHVVVLAPNFSAFIDALVWSSESFELIFPGVEEVSRILSPLEQLGASVSWSEAFSSYELSLPGCVDLEGEPARITVGKNRYKDGSGWQLSEYPESTWVGHAFLAWEHSVPILDHLRNELGDGFLVREPPRWPSDE